MTTEEKTVTYVGLSSADIQALVNELLELKEGEREYTGFSLPKTDLLIVNEETFADIEAKVNAGSQGWEDTATEAVVTEAAVKRLQEVL